MKIFSSLTLSKIRATITGVVSAAVIASGAGFVYVTAPWESPDHVNTVKPVPVKEWTPGSDTAGEHQIVDNPEANGTGKTIQGTGTGVAPTVDPSLFPADVSRAGGQAGTRSVPVKPIALAPAAAPQAPVAGNNDKGSGDFTALPGASSGSWGVTGQTGSFTWNYPFSLREAPAGATPALGIAYDSSRVDGLTSSTNNQTSPVGDGWALTGGGQIQQKFGSCMDQGVANSYDLCGNPGGQQFTISFGSRSGAIIRDATTGVYKLQNDDNTKVEYLPGAANGTFDGGYWRLTDTSGTQYWFGVNRIPGWSAGKDNYSTDIVPVYGLSGQPCYKSTGFGDSVCMQAYAWNLDYVVDLNGNSQGFFYTQDTNFYKSQAGTGPLRAYHRASRLARVDYGMRAGTELSTQAPIHVNFGYTGRCQGVTGCPTPNGDVPAEFLCASSGTCNTYSPTFFTFYRLQTVISQSLSVNPAGYGNTDFWTFFHAMPDPGDGTKPALWLGSLIHQGSNETSSTGGWITDPAIEFSGQTLHNRVWAVDGLAPFDRYRLSTIKTATGASIQVSYKAAECSQTNLPAAAETNTKRCFPQRWTPTAPIAQNPRLDHFNIYPVEKVVSKAGPGSAGTVDMVTSYTYVGTPAWKYAAPKYVSGTAGQNITWSSLAGWSQVKTTIGTAASNPTTVTTYLRGLNGTPSNTTGGLRTDSVTLSDNTVVPDSVWLAGREVEKQSYAGETGALMGTTITLPWNSAPTATGSVASGAAEARHIGIASVTKKTTTSKSAGMRVSQTSTAYDSYGRPIRTSSTGEIGVTGDESCVVTAYADNAGVNILSLPATADTYAGECTGTGPNGNLLKADRVLYDASTSAVPGSAGYVAPSKGNTARSDKATAVSGTAVTTWSQGPTLTVDALGRVIKSSDTSTGTARDTTTTYAPASGLATTVTQTNPMGWVSTTTLDSMRGQPLTKTDPNGKVTSYRYDNAGRVTGQWDPMRPAATNATPTVETSYSMSSTNPSWVKTVTIAGNGVPVASYTIYDGLGRVRQTQDQSPTGAKILTDTWYDSRGAKSTVNNKYFTSGAPDGVLVIPQLAVPSSTQYEYDAAGRPAKVRAMTGDTQELWATQISYTGMDTTTVTGPGTEAAVTTIVNLDGNTEQRSLFHGTTATGAADTSTYVYDALGQLTRMGDGANLWTWTYDAAGRETGAVDPDSGTRSTVYDAAGRTASTTDAMGTVTAYVYDTLDRPTTKTVTVSGGTAKTLETRTYDGELKGQPSSSTRNNGASYDQPVTTAFSGYNNAYQPSTTTLTLPAGLTGFAGSYTTTRSYSTSGKLRTSVSPAIGGLPAEEVRYGYDEFENPSSTWNTTGDQFGGNAQYDNLGFLTTFLQYDANAGDGSSTSNTTGTNNVYFGWDAATGRLNGQWTTNNTRGTISDLGKTTYTYSASGKLTARELAFSSRPGVASDYQCYDYDYASRLEAVWTPASKSCATVPTTASTTVAGLGGPAAYAQTYGYTAAGDRSQVKRFDATGALAVTEQYNYSAPGTAGPHQVDSIVSTPGAGGAATTQTFTWDAAGKMTGRAGQTLSYTADGRLATTTGTSTVPANPNPGAGNGTPAGPTTGAGSLGTRYYDAAGSLVGIVDGTGTTVTLGSVTAHSTPGGVKTATCTYDFAGKTVAQRTAAAGVVKLSFIIGDSINTAQTMTQPTVGAGAITAVQRYTDPYGLARGANLTGTGNNTYTAAGAGTAGVGSNAANPNGFGAANGFIAGLDDTVSSLTHLGARDMDAVTGAFTTPDPVFHTDKVEGFTPYSYSWGDPINRSDPSGLDWWGDLGKNVGDFWHDYGGRITEAVVTVAVAVVVTAVVATAATACVASVVCAIGVGIAVGATAAAAGYAAGVGMDIATGHEAPTASQFWGGMGQAALIGGLSGGSGAGISSVVGGMFRNTVINAAVRTGTSAGTTAGASAASSNLARQSFQAAQQQTKNIGNQATARAATTPAASGSGPSSLYHYTDEAGMKGILGSKQLRPSLSSVNPKDARYGNGQYLSDIEPGTKTCAQLSRCFLGMPFQPQRFSNFVEVDVTGLTVVKGRDAVFVVPGESELDLTGRILSWGANEAK